MDESITEPYHLYVSYFITVSKEKERNQFVLLLKLSPLSPWSVTAVPPRLGTKWKMKRFGYFVCCWSSTFHSVLGVSSSSHTFVWMMMILIYDTPIRFLYWWKNFAFPTTCVYTLIITSTTVIAFSSHSEIGARVTPSLEDLSPSLISTLYPHQSQLRLEIAD